jgi:hypothetical protein
MVFLLDEEFAEGQQSSLKLWIPLRYVGSSIQNSVYLPLRSSKTCSAVVGLGFPARFALGAAIGQPLSLIRAKATLCLGILTAIVSKPATVTSWHNF